MDSFNKDRREIAMPRRVLHAYPVWRHTLEEICVRRSDPPPPITKWEQLDEEKEETLEYHQIFSVEGIILMMQATGPQWK